MNFKQKLRQKYDLDELRRQIAIAEIDIYGKLGMQIANRKHFKHLYDEFGAIEELSILDKTIDACEKNLRGSFKAYIKISQVIASERAKL